MMHTFADFWTVLSVTVADQWALRAPDTGRPGPALGCSDPELVTMAVVGECMGWAEETVLRSRWRDYPHLFPHQPTRTRFNRRRRFLAGAINRVRQRVVGLLHPTLAHA